MNVSDAMSKAHELAKLVPQLCPKDRAAYWKHEADFTGDVVNVAFRRLKNACHAAYDAITSKEATLDTEQAIVKKDLENTQDLTARLEKVEGNSDSLLKSMECLQASPEKALQEKEQSRKEAERRYVQAKANARAAEERIKRKHEVNANIVSGVMDWFSRSDVGR